MSKLDNHLEKAQIAKGYGVKDHYYETLAVENGTPKPAIEVNFATQDSNGATPEDLIAVTIGRLDKLNGELPCRETSLAITKLEEALMWLNYRTVDRKRRGVEGTMME